MHHTRNSPRPVNFPHPQLKLVFFAVLANMLDRVFHDTNESSICSQQVNLAIRINVHVVRNVRI